MGELGFFLLLLIVPQVSLQVEALPPELQVKPGKSFSLQLIIEKDEGQSWPPRVRPVSNLPEGIELEGVSARSGSPKAGESESNSLEYLVTLRAAESGEYRLDQLGISFFDPETGSDREIAAGAVAVRVKESGFWGIGFGWLALLLLLILVGVVLVIWIFNRGSKRETAVEPQSLDREWAWKALEDIRRHRIRGEEVELLQKIGEVESRLADRNPEAEEALEEKIEKLKYGGQRPAPAELEEIYRRVELKIKSRFPEEEEC